VSQFDVRDDEPQGFSDFQIRHSRRDATPTVRIAPDLVVCDECLQEMRNPADRRYRYPYINCTNCGPRYSIIERLPYDRANTTMAAWQLCEACRTEYENPLDRRYHAQPTACPQCGPNYRLIATVSSGESATGNDSIAEAARLLRNGQILAIKGIGGYHLACDATNNAAVDRLRTRKFRKEKPFAVMARDLAAAHEIVHLSLAHETLLTSVARPIVLAPAKIELAGVAPDTLSLGVMLPYAPLHHLLFDHGAPSPLVLTSANRSSEPIAYRDEDALDQLAGIADWLLVGERPIQRRVDDSVVTVRAGQTSMFRRSRGFAPGVVARLPTDKSILALGGDLKNTVALVVGGEVFVSQHIGDLDESETRQAFEETVADLLAVYEVQPRQLTVAHDLHPQFYSTRFAGTLQARRCVAIQHHQAHIASVLAEHELWDEDVLGIALDGTGYGSDETIWGGELFAGSIARGFERVSSLRPVSMPGGDAAARFPVQAAAGFLAELSDLPDLTQPPFGFPRRYINACSLVAKDFRCFRSTSAGRLFDAVAALAGFTRETTFEGQAAIWLETQARQATAQPAYPMPDLDHRPLFKSVIADRLAGRAPSEIAYAFHAGLAEELVRQACRLCHERQLRTVALSGGVFQNDLLFERMLRGFAEHETLRVITNQQVPANDGGLCLGQAALAMSLLHV
jgi:hydrogenase maturation protein HypF